MNGATKLALAVGLPVAVLIAAGQSAAAVTPPTEPPGTELGVSIPADFVALTDDTGTITVMVPGSWTDVSTAQVGVIPTIEASTDREAYNATFDVAGVTYRAAPFREDTETAAREFGIRRVRQRGRRALQRRCLRRVTPDLHRVRRRRFDGRVPRGRRQPGRPGVDRLAAHPDHRAR